MTGTENHPEEVQVFLTLKERDEAARKYRKERGPDVFMHKCHSVNDEVVVGDKFFMDLLSANGNGRRL